MAARRSGRSHNTAQFVLERTTAKHAPAAHGTREATRRTNGSIHDRYTLPASLKSKVHRVPQRPPRSRDGGHVHIMRGVNFACAGSQGHVS